MFKFSDTSYFSSHEFLQTLKRRDVLHGSVLPD